MAMARTIATTKGNDDDGDGENDDNTDGENEDDGDR